MQKIRIPIIFFLSVLGITLSLFCQDKGVVVEKIGKFSAGEQAGVQKGDILFSWERSANPPANPKPAGGVITSVFDFKMVETEQGPRGPVKLTGERAGQKMTFEVPVGEWKIKIRPLMSEGDIQIYQKANSLIETKEVEKEMAVWKELAQSERAAQDLLFSCWIQIQKGNSWVKQRKWDEAQSAYQRALELANKSQNSSAQAAVWYAKSKSFQKQNNFQKAGEMTEPIQKIWEESLGESLSLAVSLNNLGVLAYYRGELDLAETFHKQAQIIRKKLAPDSTDMASSYNNLGLVESRRGNIKEAELYYNEASALWEKLAPISLPTALTYNNLSIVAYRKGKLEDAEEYQKKALSIREKIAPDSSDVAMSLNNLGVFAERRGHITLAESYYKRALTINEKLSPGSMPIAYNLTNLATIAEKRGDLRKAEVLHKQALAIRKKIAPNSIQMTASLNNLGVVAGDRGYLELAESYHRQALAIREKLAPDSFAEASSLANLGVVARLQGDQETAESCIKRALALFEKLTPGSFHVAGLMSNLGSVFKDKGDLEAAEDYYRRALELREKTVPNSFDHAESLNNLGVIIHKKGDLEKAKTYHEQALAIRENLAPGSPLAATSLNNLGTIARDQKELNSAETYFLDALSIWEKWVPGNISEANTLHELGLLYLKRNEMEKAKEHYQRSLESLEIQISRLGGSQEIKAGFRTKYGHYYQDYIELLMRMKKHEEAFHVLERSKAQLFLAMLTERDLVFTTDIPEELEKTRNLTDWEYDQTQKKLTQLNPKKDKEEIEQLSNQLRELRRQQSSITEKIKKASPRLASLQYPQPLDVKQTQAVLDPGTIMLSYSVGKEKSYLFAVTSDNEFLTFPLSIKEKDLREEIERFRTMIQRSQARLKVQESLVSQGNMLYERLIQPAEEMINQNKRIVIVPDGPLHVLPFGALVQKTGNSWQYLIEERSLHTVLSATVYSELIKQRQTSAAKKTEKTIVAFGDPKYPSEAEGETKDSGDSFVRSLVKRGTHLTPLPATREEVSMIAQIYRDRAEVYLGDEATEERAKAISKDVRYVHFACHGLLDEHFPLNSGIALTIPAELKEEKDNGILQAWEVFERVRIDADLVVLSACETGLGKEMGGEGLVGLTRAFQYAGAHTVLASLWEVADVASAELMKSFYGYLKEGLSKDEALQKAKIDMIQHPDISHPFFWGAFQLIGDWQ